MWIIPLIAHLICNTGYNTMLRHAAGNKKVAPLFLATILSTAVAAPAAVGIFIAKIDWSLFDIHIILLYAAAIAITALFHIVNAKALEITEASVFSFLFTFRIGFATLFGIGFLSESVVPLSLVGGALVFVAGSLLTGKSTARPKGVMLSILAAVLMATLNALEKHLITQVGYAGYVFPSALIIAGILWLVLLFSRPRINIDKAFMKTKEFPFLMVIRCISAYGFTIALGAGAVLSVATYISALTCVTTPIAAVIFLKETDSLLKKTIAGLIALAGVTLIFIASR